MSFVLKLASLAKPALGAALALALAVNGPPVAQAAGWDQAKAVEDSLKMVQAGKDPLPGPRPGRRRPVRQHRLSRCGHLLLGRGVHDVARRQTADRGQLPACPLHLLHQL